MAMHEEEGGAFLTSIADTGAASTPPPAATQSNNRRKHSIAALTASLGKAESAQIPNISATSDLAFPEAVRYEMIADQIVSREKTLKSLWKTLFLESHEVEEIAKGIFWWFVCDEFQPNRHEATKAILYSRISSQYVDYYLRCRRCRRDSELLPGHQDVHNTQFFNSFHDPLAQIVYFSLRAAYPLSRAALDLQFKRRLLRTLSNWTTGFSVEVPQCSHWMEDNQISGSNTKRTPASRKNNPALLLAEFPALKNRMDRQNKLERIFTISKSADGAVGMAAPNDNDDGAEGGPQFRTAYKMVHTPLVQHFLDTHKLDSQSERLSTLLRLTSDAKRNFDTQLCLKKVDVSATHIFHNNQKQSKEYRQLMSHVASSSNQARKDYDTFKEQWRKEEKMEKKHLREQERKLDQEHQRLVDSGNVQEYSNLLASNLLACKGSRSRGRTKMH